MLNIKDQRVLAICTGISSGLTEGFLVTPAELIKVRSVWGKFLSLRRLLSYLAILFGPGKNRLQDKDKVCLIVHSYSPRDQFLSVTF